MRDAVRARARRRERRPAPITAIGVPQHADALDLQLDDVAALQPAPVAVLEDAAAADRARADHVARAKHRVPRAPARASASQPWYRSREVAARALLAVHARDHLPVAAVELVGRDEHRPERRREVLALRRPEPDAHLLPLQVARRPVVQHREAADLPLGADHRGALELVVELLRPLRIRDLVVRPVDRGRVREVEDRHLVPLLRHLGAARAARAFATCSSNAMKSRTRRRLKHRRAQVDVGERVLGVLARRAAAGEERLQRLRGELDHLVALDPPGPAALERELPRREHAELHGSVWTITSAMSGRSRRIRSSISLARAWASSSRLRAVEARA